MSIRLSTTPIFSTGTQHTYSSYFEFSPQDVKTQFLVGKSYDTSTRLVIESAITIQFKSTT